MAVPEAQVKTGLQLKDEVLLHSESERDQDDSFTTPIILRSQTLHSCKAKVRQMDQVVLRLSSSNLFVIRAVRMAVGVEALASRLVGEKFDIWIRVMCTPYTAS